MLNRQLIESLRLAVKTSSITKLQPETYVPSLPTYQS